MSYIKQNLLDLVKNKLALKFDIDWNDDKYINANDAIDAISEAINEHVIQTDLISANDTTFIVNENLQVNQNTNLNSLDVSNNATISGNTYLQDLYIKNNIVYNIKVIDISTDVSGNGSYNLGNYNVLVLIPIYIDTEGYFKIDTARVRYNNPNIELQGSASSNYKVVCFYL